MGREELISYPRSVEMAARVTNRKLVNGAIDNWLTKFASRDAAITLLREAHIAHAPVLMSKRR